MPRWNDGLVDAFPVPDDALSKLSLSRTIDDSQTTDTVHEGNSALDLRHTTEIFPFFSLPAELRNRIYTLVLFDKPSYGLATGKRKGSCPAVLLASKRFHREASYTLYTTHKFLIFPVQEFTALPTIRELPLHYRVLVFNLVIRIGSSWTNPPKSWRVNNALRRCLINLKNVQTLSVFVEFDPSHPTLQKFRKFRISETFYTDFSGELLKDVLKVLPQIKHVQLDGNPGVNVNGPLVSRLREEVLGQGKQVRWGEEAGWAHKIDLPPQLSETSQASHSATVLSHQSEFPWPGVVNVNASMLHNSMRERVKNV